MVNGYQWHIVSRSAAVTFFEYLTDKTLPDATNYMWYIYT